MESIQNFFKNLWERFKAWVEANPRRAAIYGGAIFLLIISFFVPVPEPHVSLAGEPILENGPAWLTNSLLTTFIVDIVVILLAVTATARMQLIPSGWQNFMEMVLEYLYGLSETIAGPYVRKFFPWVATIFIFVIISNWSGLIPGMGSIGFIHSAPHGEPVEAEGEAHAQALEQRLAMVDGNLTIAAPVAVEAAPAAATEGEGYMVPLFRAPSADFNMTFGLAIVVMVMVQVWGVRALGAGYFGKFFVWQGETGFMKGVNAFVGFLELISEFSRLLAFGFRLFGNVFAGEIMLATLAFLIPFLVPIPFYVLEIFVGFVQALVFMMLALVFWSVAMISHGHEEHHDGEHHAVETHDAGVEGAAAGTAGS